MPLNLCNLTLEFVLSGTGLSPVPEPSTLPSLEAPLSPPTSNASGLTWFFTMTLTAGGSLPWDDGCGSGGLGGRRGTPPLFPGFPNPPPPALGPLWCPSESSGTDCMASLASMSGMSNAASKSSKSGVFISPIPVTQTSICLWSPDYPF